MFITLEGPEGSGKTSHIPYLVEYLREKGYIVFPTREPGGTTISEQIRDILHDLKNAEMHPRTETLLYQAARAQIVEQVIKPRLDAGEIVISDRYYDSTIAYQGYGHQQDLEQVRALVKYATGGLTPDLTILLDLEIEVGLKRKMQNEMEWNRMDAYTVEFHKRVHVGYLEMVQQEPQRWVVINSDQKWDDVQAELKKSYYYRINQIMIVDSEEDIKYLKTIGHICAVALKTMMEQAKPGITTGELDNIGKEFLAKEGAQSAPMAMYQFPGATCISISPVIAHGIPGDHVLREGELINIDVSAELNGYFADTGGSMVVAKHVPQYEKMLEATKSALAKAVQVARAGQPLNLIGKTIQDEAKRNGFGVIYDLTGHGIGRKLHDQPAEIYNYYKQDDRRILNEGVVLAIEPFLTTGKGHVLEERDGWSLRTIDRTIAAQFEHTIIVTKDEPIILTI